MFTLRATLSDGFVVNFPEQYSTQEHANRAAASYMKHYSDPCGMGVHVSYVSTIDEEARK